MSPNKDKEEEKKRKNPPKKEKEKEKKRKNPPSDLESDDSTSDTEAEMGEVEANVAEDAEEDNIRLSKSAVHKEYVAFRLQRHRRSKPRQERESRLRNGSRHASTVPRRRA